MVCRFFYCYARKIIPRRVIFFFRYLKFFGGRLRSQEKYIKYVNGVHGVEIGGPSILFKTKLPLYKHAKVIDGVNFSSNTVWEGNINQGGGYRVGSGYVGKQYILDAINLSEIVSGKYDFLLSSNCLEHVANPIKALFEWCRIIKVGGAIILVLPNKKSNFDHRRAVTPFSHLLDDYKKNVEEDDLSHLGEILNLHDLSRDPMAGSKTNFYTRSLDNYNNRTLHHHVFDLNSMAEMLSYVGFDVVDLIETHTDLFALAIKSK